MMSGAAMQLGGAMLAMLLVSAAPVPAQEIIRYQVGRGGEGNAMTVARDGERYTIDYESRENGRGPKYRETLELGPDGLPTLWHVAGKTTFGSAVDERFERSGGRVVWRSQAETGDQAASNRLYIVNDGSPFALGVYARALRKAPGMKLAALPYGELSLTRIKDATADVAGRKTTLTLYRIDGIDVTPSYVTLDEIGALVSAGSIVREGYRDAVTAMGRASDDDELAEAHKRLAHRADAPVEIRNVRVFDPVKGALSASSDVVAFRGRITQVRPHVANQPLPKGSKVIDGAGGTLVPGLHDMHAHLRARGGLFYLAAGVTAVRDQGNGEALLSLMRRIEAGELGGPRVVPNLLLEGISPYSSNSGFLPKTLEEAREKIQWAADRGYFQIKIYNSIAPEWVKPLADEAHRHGMGVTGHVPAFVAPDDAIRSGYDDIAHINQLMLGWVLKPGEDTRTTLRLTGMARFAGVNLDSAPVKATMALMQKHKVALDTTAVIVERLMLSRARHVQPGDVDYLDHMPVAYQRYRRRSFVPLENAQDDANWKAAFARVVTTMKMLHARGIQLLPGTDDATGFTVHREVELYTLAGIPNAEALALATLGCERYMGRDANYGSIVPGKVSDFFLIPGDPLKDIRAIKRIAMVMRGDTIYYPQEIYQVLGVKPFQAPPRILAQ